MHENWSMETLFKDFFINIFQRKPKLAAKIAALAEPDVNQPAPER